MNRKQLLLSSAVICALGAAAWGPAVAQEATFPTKPITLVIPFPPGGATDVLGRLIGKKLGDKLGQSVVIDNRAGAGTTIGAAYVAKAAPDGYTLLMSSGTTFTVNPAVRAKLPYDPVKSFEPIGIAGRTSLILLANKDVPVSDVKQFVAMVKAGPDKYSYGSYGAGTTSQFAGEMFFHAAGLKIQHVPYKGSSPAMVDLMGGQIPFTVDTVSAALPQLKDGKIKAIAVTAGKRSALLPKVPTLAESGYPGVEMDTWLAMVAPRGLPPAVKARLELTLAQVVADPETRDKLIAVGFEPTYASAKAVSELIDKELPLMRAVAQRAAITAD
ncbi:MULTISPECIES: tripartite tricarboxylate transporter substrate binding protein [Acidovorax]|uniref:Bug family tripartite tricarboxylate transporter substrate binding protein n=1 Tax=Acidovorax facilis TaxID=12917 RepID=A0ABV8DK01_9BURK|nr:MULTISPECIES: tripartite tricarboxylate transporter substrate binding protein [Acidovorax]OGB08662.1 MAG: ABC transporter substrate-binding protein [Burkholderiales bacterium RIFCSPHIGHO2_02_FULL_64_19]OGB25611.1 MAG: ABC transporter substrate-binding protein [Burkholderiales bacterium RIFCSPHIGHO2_12_FULL_65_48]OGB56027.1 MAG: ABC transporter substrate-binding protein [Burkholderiales bacterium RIFCSPLOWO2_12_FULL_64_33]KQB60378.1 ABC transporter substrate-binding protein [Acidovorax sp. SD